MCIRNSFTTCRRDSECRRVQNKKRGETIGLAQIILEL